MKKRIGALVMVLAVSAAVLAGCGSSAETKTANAAQNKTNLGKTLVVYYSNTGSTEAVAKEIARATGGDLFEVVADPDYTQNDLDWTNPNSRVNREHNDPSLRNVALKNTKVPNWSSYKTVFIGYPIWWGDYAWPIGGFVRANDFTGKTVYPFATSMSSPLADSGKNLAKLTTTGNWKDGQRFEPGASASTVDNWVKSL